MRDKVGRGCPYGHYLVLSLSRSRNEWLLCDSFKNRNLKILFSAQRNEQRCHIGRLSIAKKRKTKNHTTSQGSQTRRDEGSDSREWLSELANKVLEMSTLYQ